MNVQSILCHKSRAILLSFTLLCSPAGFAVEAINTTFFGDLAIEGYDPVAYFKENRPVKGNRKFEFNWMNANWRFSSQKNLDLFKENPDQYAPQYGGYCAYAVAQNDTASIKPELFTIHNNKLYLNYNEKINKKWRADKDRLISQANRNWPQLSTK